MYFKVSNFTFIQVFVVVYFKGNYILFIEYEYCQLVILLCALNS